jgi:hypothetical protein
LVGNKTSGYGRPMHRPSLDDALVRQEQVLRAFVLPDGRLRSIPTKISKRLVILNLVAQEFEIGRTYAETEVNAAVRRFHDDVAALRRYLVEEGFLERRDGRYWRAGGTVDSPAQSTSQP